MLRIEVSGAAIAHNIRLLRGAMGDQVRFCAVVKSNAYGHGIDLVGPIIAQHADWLAVASPGEALELRELGYEGPLLMLFCASVCGRDAEGVSVLTRLIRQAIVLTVVGPEDVDLIGTVLAANPSFAARVHIEVDTGMTRSGVSPDQLGAVLEKIGTLPQIEIDGIYTHFATADEEADDFVQLQYNTYCNSINPLSSNSYSVKHCSNSAAAIRFDAFRGDMVRVGLMMYGYRPAPGIAPHLDLRPALRLVSTLMQIHDVPTGTRVGYGLTFTCTRPSRIGLVAGGYGDGYLRALSNCGVVRIGTHTAPVVGRVSMDQITVDLTDIPDACVGDQVELIANEYGSPNNAAALAEKADTIPYEILTRMDSHRVERVLIDS